jgi:hypothetical protein
MTVIMIQTEIVTFFTRSVTGTVSSFLLQSFFRQHSIDIVNCRMCHCFNG